MMNLPLFPIQLDQNEAPKGFYAVLKSDVITDSLGNICNACDWRSECQKPTTDFKDHNNRCMSYAVVLNDGTELERKDGCSVAFKKRQ